MKPLINKFPAPFAFLISAMITASVFIVVLLASFEVIVRLYPSQEVVADGRIIKHEAFAQFFGSLFISAVVSITLFVFAYLKLSKKFENFYK